MEIGNWQATSGLNESYRLIRELGLEANIAELDTFGFTVIPPEKAAPAGFADRLREKLLEYAAVDDADNAYNKNDGSARGAYGKHLFHLVKRDRVFREALVLPVPYAMGAYLMGASARVYNQSAIVKAGEIGPTHLHCDSFFVPAPLPAYGLVCNCSWLLSEYTIEKGALCMVPGSHRYCRNPSKDEQPKCLGGTASDDMLVPVIAEPGSLCIFHGNTWHGAYPKKTNDVRVNTVSALCRHFVLPGEDTSDVTDEEIAPHGEKLAKLLGREHWWGWRDKGPQPTKLAQATLAGQSAYN